MDLLVCLDLLDLTLELSPFFSFFSFFFLFSFSFLEVENKFLVISEPPVSTYLFNHCFSAESHNVSKKMELLPSHSVLRKSWSSESLVGRNM